MWALRILTGPQTGQILNLKLGKNLLGRGPACDIKITSHGVSKEHSEIHVYKDKIMIVDLKSSNGTFVNGVRVQNGLVRLGDKASVHDVIFDIIPADIIPIRSVAQPASGYNSNPASAIPMMGSAAPQYYPEAQAGYMGGAPQMMPSPQMMSGQPGFEEEAAPSFETAPRSFVQNFLFQLKDYLERVALPGIYRLPQLAEFKYVLAGFIVLFVLTVTLLSMIPMIQITRSSILEESQRRAQSLARNVAMTNQTLLLQGSFSSLNTHSAETEEGVKQVMIVQQSDGMILA
ncbi:MAG: FHA domain-containing protein, partial [Proteobacteria bacterium]